MTPSANPPHPWRPGALIWCSVALHIAASVLLAFLPQYWPWAIGAFLFNHLLLTAIGLYPRSTWLGLNLTRLPFSGAEDRERTIALSFDDGPNPAITPWVLDQLEHHQAKATFFCVGAQVRAHPELAQEIVRRGHMIENHSDWHSYAFSTYGLRRLARDIRAAQATITQHTGQTPTLFRAPAGLRSPLLAPVLAREGLTLASWTRRGFDTVERDSQIIFARLTRGLAAGDILLLHDGNGALDHQQQPVIFTVLPALLAQIDALGLRVVPIRAHQTAVKAHPSTIS